VTNSLELRTVIDACVRRKKSDKGVDVAVVNEEAVVAVQSIDTGAQHLVWCVVGSMQFAPLQSPQYANERLVG
jgi:hypothetical protein